VFERLEAEDTAATVVVTWDVAVRVRGRTPTRTRSRSSSNRSTRRRG